MEQKTLLETKKKEETTMTLEEEAMWEMAHTMKYVRKPYTVKDYVKKYFIPNL